MLDVEPGFGNDFPFMEVVQTQGFAFVFRRGGGLAEW